MTIRKFNARLIDNIRKFCLLFDLCLTKREKSATGWPTVKKEMCEPTNDNTQNDTDLLLPISLFVE